MNPVVASFSLELVKLASHEDPEDHSTRNYLASALLGAAAAPSVGLAANAVGRALRNRGLRKVLSGSKLEKALERGPLLGHARPAHLPPSPVKALMTYDDLAAKAVTGGLTGSAVQAVRDRLTPPKAEEEK